MKYATRPGSQRVDGLDPRRQELWALHDYSIGRGLEIGPLHDPIVSKGQADVRYVDIHDGAGLRAYYRDHPEIPIDDIPEIDYPLTQADGRIVSLAEASRAGAPFDWAIASHVVEHVPDLIGWLGHLAEVIADGGSLVLVVPDRRYCFDVHRPPSTVGAMLEAHLLGAVRPGVRAVYDHYSSVVRYDPARLWDGDTPGYDDRHHDLPETLDWVEKSLTEYVDCHVWLFTPDSFADQVRELRLIGRCEWYVETVRPTKTHEIEFMVKLRRLPREHERPVEVDGEHRIAADRPDWLDDPTRIRRAVAAEQRAAALEADAVRLEARLERRSRRTRRLSQRIERQRAELDRHQREMAALRARPVRHVLTESLSSLARRLRRAR